jgi:hypothetical protein
MRAIFNIFIGCIFILSLFFLSSCDDIDLFSVNYGADDPINNDCDINHDIFDGNWMKYSDIDYRIPTESRSLEAQGYFKMQEQIVQIESQIFILKRDIQIEIETREEVLAYKNALVNNIKTNLLKSFWRLTWITYDAIQGSDLIKGGYNRAKSFSSLFLSAEKGGIQFAGEYMKLARAYTPKDNPLSANTKTIEGKVEDVARAGWMETMASMGDPIKTGTQIVATATKRALPSADIAPGEFEILKQQQLNNRVLDEIIQTSYKNQFEMTMMMNELEDEKRSFESKLLDFEDNEKDRTRDMLVKECKSKKWLSKLSS